MPHPDFVLVGKGIVIVNDDDDNARVIDGLHIGSVEDLPIKKGQEVLAQ